MKRVDVWFDGSCNPNPGGEMGWGCRIEKDKEVVFQASERSEPTRYASNNVAEYYGLEMALTWLIDNYMTHDHVYVHGDSNLVINQMSGNWKIKNGFYADAAMSCRDMVRQFDSIRFQWIPRHENQHCDDLSKEKTSKPNKPVFSSRMSGSYSGNIRVEPVDNFNEKKELEVKVKVAVDIKGFSDTKYTCHLPDYGVTFTSRHESVIKEQISEHLQKMLLLTQRMPTES